MYCSCTVRIFGPTGISVKMNIYTLCHQNLDIFILKTIVYNGFVNAELKGLSQNLRNRNSICNLAK